MRRIKFLPVLVLLALLLSMGPGVVLAQEPPPDWSDPVALRALIEQLAAAGDDADELWAELPPEAQAAALEYVKFDRFVTTVTPLSGRATLLSRGCKWVQIERSGYNVFGQKLWSYFQKIDWCYDGSKITSKFRTRWGDVYAPFWQFTGHIGNSEQGGVNQWYYRAWTQGEFRLCLGGDIGCIQYKYPWIDMTVYGNGNYTWSAGG